MARTLWLRWMAALCGSLVVGCLFQRPGRPPEPAPVPTEQARSASAPPAAPPDPSPPEPTSPYAQLPGPIAPAAPIQTASHETPQDAPRGPRRANAEEPPAAIPAPLDPFTVAVSAVLKEQPDEALRALEKRDPNDRELMLALIRLAVGIDRKDLARLSADEASGTLERLRHLTAQLRQRARLSLGKTCFCKSIEGFGQYETCPARTYEFRAGSDGLPGERVQVYVEVRNFGCVAKQDQYETRLSSTLSILDERDKEVTTMTPETAVDLSQTPRQDYFLNFQFHVPVKLEPGTYTLRVNVEDVTPAEGANKAERSAKRTLAFRVGPPGPRPEK